MSSLLYLVIYDLPYDKAGNKRRNRLHKLLSGFGKWTQYSVFECFLSDLQFAKLQVGIQKIIKPNQDSVRIYVLDATAVKRTITYGSDKPSERDTIVI
ncbi:MAG: CRISPR-associated endonuclease Cas2 [Pseudanabaenaceae cyanobacterium SKYGB_i_bin29]|nr:CRISPR-associated endonuclease Cas2 [Pseudanabaenaceae cyanobacterium SKYG29]MDW8420999.1 CRISPR-associated endonuclease Cas2 [Pseudanabaenaceae cyanobacterium SKYGB_i_bin29]